MTAVSPLVFPGSRSLASWWRDLAPVQPRRLWVSHLLLHRVEAVAALKVLASLDRTSLFVLRAVALSATGLLHDLDQRLHLGLSLLRQLLRQLESEKLIQSREQGGWRVTELGQEALG